MTIQKSQFWVVLAGIVTSSIIGFNGVAVTAQTDKSKAESKAAAEPAAPKKSPRQHFMEGKLIISQEILRGVVLHDFKLIESSATGMNVLTLAEEWRMDNSKEFERMSEDLRRISKQLVRAGRDKDINAATLAYQRLTLNCVECHQSVIDGLK